LRHNQPIYTVLAGTSALVTSDAQHRQLADDVAECDRAVAGHHNHPSTRNARSMCQARADGFFPTARQLPPLVNLPPLGVQLVTMAAAPVPDARATRFEC
jgi:hypothetical protein